MKTIFRQTLIVILLVASTTAQATMGMSYDIIPNKKIKCANNFGNGLSFFFEQIGGYGETAEVEQVSRILGIDLSVFQDVNYNYEDSTDISGHWHSIDSLSLLIEEFISKIQNNPDYYKQVLHNPDIEKQLEEENRIWNIEDSTERDTQLNSLRAQPFYYYPPDYGYLRDGRIFNDLRILKQTLICYKKSGATEIRLTYM